MLIDFTGSMRTAMTLVRQQPPTYGPGSRVRSEQRSNAPRPLRCAALRCAALLVLLTVDETEGTAGGHMALSLAVCRGPAVARTRMLICRRLTCRMAEDVLW